MDLRKEVLRYIDILSPKRRQYIWKWVNGYDLNEIARAAKTSVYRVNANIKKSIDMIDLYCYNRDRYKSIFGHLFDEWKRNTRRVHPVRCFDSKWGLTHQEVWLLKLWKVDGRNSKTIMKRMRISESTLNQYKVRIAKKVGMNEFERRTVDNSWDGSDFASDFELSGI